MKIAIMQPYFFPYLGYVQLMNAVDTFVFFDDVNYIKRGWINRNNILSPSGAQRITLPVQKASQNRLIKDHQLGDGKDKLLRSLELAYGKAPFFEQTMPLLRACLGSDEENLALFLENSLRKLAAHLEMDTHFARSSDTAKPPDGLKAQDHIIHICKAHDAGHYINPEGGRDLYEAEVFKAQQMALSFLVFEANPYCQFKADAEFVSHLSVIDALMFTGVDGTKAMLSDYRLES